MPQTTIQKYFYLVTASLLASGKQFIYVTGGRYEAHKMFIRYIFLHDLMLKDLIFIDHISLLFAFL